MGSLKDYFKIDTTLGFARPDCIFKGEKYRITILSDVLLRLEYNENKIFNDYPTLFAINRKFTKMPTFTKKEDEKFLNITNDYFILEYNKEKPFAASKLIPDSNLRISIQGTDKIWYVNHPEVKNLKGATYSFDTKNFTLERGLYSLDGVASFNDSCRPVFVSDGTVKKNPSDGMDIYLFVYKDNFEEALNSYYELTGKPSLIPRYALGVWWNKNEDYTSDDITSLINNFKKSDIPISTLLLGNKWNKTEGKLSPTFNYNDKKFPNFIETANNIHRNGIYFGLTVNPQNGITPLDPGYQNLKTMLNETKEIIPINVYNNTILEFLYTYLIEYLNQRGVDFINFDIKAEDKIAQFMLMHYTYMNFKKDASRRGLIMSRNPGIASHRYPIMYSGVTEVSWKTLKYLPFYNISSSNIGLTWWSHDIGGYENGTEDAELYTRYVQLGVYSPIFRFSSKEGRYYKREPWKWDVKTQGIVKDYTRVRHRLIPYIYSEAYKYSKHGINLIKPLYYDYKETIDEPLYKNEYHFGSELFVCPITEPKDKVMNRVLHRIYLPEGTWYDFKTGKKFPGGKRYVTFYKDEDYPVYAKSGSIIPLAIIDENNINSVLPPKKMEIQVFPGVSNNINLYEDDGISSLYKEGYYILTNIDYNYRKNNYTLILRPIEGKTGIVPDKRDYKIKFRNTKRPEYVKVNVGRFEVEFTTRCDESDFIIEIPNVPTNQQLTVNCGGEAIEIDAVRLINEDIDEIISDLQIETNLKEQVASILFSDLSIRKKRIEIRKMRRKGLNKLFIKMFIKLLEYISEIWYTYSGLSINLYFLIPT